MPCGCSAAGSGRSTTMLSIVSRTNFMSWRWAPSIARPIGTPCPSVNRLRFAPFFPGRWDCCRYLPRPGVLWSSLRPCLAKPNRSLVARQTVPRRLSIASERPPLVPIPEIGHGRSSQDRDRFDRGLSIGNRSETHKRWHRHICDLAHAVARRQSDGCSHGSVAAVAARPTIRPICGSTS